MTNWYGRDYENMGFIFFVVVIMTPFFLFTMAPVIPDGLERNTTYPPRVTWLSIDGDCPAMYDWIVEHPEAWHQDEKILRYNFICEERVFI